MSADALNWHLSSANPRTAIMIILNCFIRNDFRNERSSRGILQISVFMKVIILDITMLPEIILFPRHIRILINKPCVVKKKESDAEVQVN